MAPTPKWIDHDHIEIPATAESEGIQGDGAFVIGSDNPNFSRWADWMTLKGMERPEK